MNHVFSMLLSGVPLTFGAPVPKPLKVDWEKSHGSPLPADEFVKKYKQDYGGFEPTKITNSDGRLIAAVEYIGQKKNKNKNKIDLHVNQPEMNVKITEEGMYFPDSSDPKKLYEFNGIRHITASGHKNGITFDLRDYKDDEKKLEITTTSAHVIYGEKSEATDITLKSGSLIMDVTPEMFGVKSSGASFGKTHPDNETLALYSAGVGLGSRVSAETAMNGKNKEDVVYLGVRDSKSEKFTGKATPLVTYEILEKAAEMVKNEKERDGRELVIESIDKAMDSALQNYKSLQAPPPMPPRNEKKPIQR